MLSFAPRSASAIIRASKPDPAITMKRSPLTDPVSSRRRSPCSPTWTASARSCGTWRFSASRLAVPAGGIATPVSVPATASTQRWTEPSPPQTNSTSTPLAAARRAYLGARRLLSTSYHSGSVTPSRARISRSSGRPPPKLFAAGGTTATSAIGSDLSPAGFAQPVDAEDQQPERGQQHQELAERLVPERQQRLVDAAGVGRLVRDRGGDNSRPGQAEDHSAGDRPGHAEYLDDAAGTGAHLPRLQVLHDLLADALHDQDDAGDDDGRPDQADQHPAVGVAHGGGSEVLLPLGLALGLAVNHGERQVGEGGVDDRPAQRLEPRADAGSLAGDAERGLAQPPQGVGGEADAEQPQRDQPVGLAREQLQGAELIGLALALSQRDQHRDQADEDVDDAAGGQAGASQEMCRRAIGRPPCRAHRARRRC